MVDTYGRGLGVRPPSRPSSGGSRPLPVPTYGGGGGGGPVQPKAQENGDFTDVGKTSVSVVDLNSIVNSAQNLASFGSGLVGGVAGAIGGIGFGDGKNLGAIGDVPGNVLGAVGGVELPRVYVPGVGNPDPSSHAHLGDVPGLVGDVLSAPSRFLETELGGKRRVGQYLDPGQYGGFDIAQRKRKGIEGEQATLPPDIADALDSGQISADEAANLLVARGAGYADNPIVNTIGEMIIDPLNLILPGAGRLGAAIRGAGEAVKIGEETNVVAGLAGRAYNIAAKNLTGARELTVGKLLGPSTSGFVRAIGVPVYKGARSRLSRISPAYGDALDEALGVANAQYPYQLAARTVEDEITVAIATRAGRSIEEATARFGGAQGLQSQLIQTVKNMPTLNGKHLATQVQELAAKVLPRFRNQTAERITADAAAKFAHITGASEEDVLRAFGGKINRETAAMADNAMYGKAISDFGPARAAALGAKNIDASRLTIISHHTLTVDRAKDILAGKIDIGEALETFSGLGSKFLPTSDPKKVREYIQNLLRNDLLPETVKAPVSGKNALPSALGTWRETYSKFGYELGFAPKDALKVIETEDGTQILRAPFAHVVTDADPVQVANPLGRFVEAMFRAPTQVMIVNTAKQRMLDEVVKLGVPESEGKRLFGAILTEARVLDMTPRGLGGFGGHAYDRLFRDVLGDVAYAELKQKADPAWIVMRAFEGNWREVGLTQKFTGAIKTLGAKWMGNMPAAIAEGIWPKTKFKYRPFFQLQELVESPFFQVINGIRPVPEGSDDVARIMKAWAEQGDEFRYTWEAGYVTHLIGNEWATKFADVRNPVGKALGGFIERGGVRGVKERARVAQVMYEHGDYFRDSVLRVNPPLWKQMVEAYGTKDPREIAKAFIEERFRLIDDPGAVKAFIGPTASADETTVMNALQEGWRQSMVRAFKTHYFNPERGFLERTINHPYLGLYPASYMWGKVVPQFARFLLLRPFGLNAPLLGLTAYTRVQQAVNAEIATNPELAQFLKDHKGSINFIQLLLPALPSDIPVNAPAYARHLSADVLSGKQVKVDAFARREASDIATYSSVAGDVGTFLTPLTEAGRDITDVLSRAAAEFDGMFGSKK